MRTIRFILIAAAAVLAVSCAEERSESAESVQDRILKAYVEKYYPDAVRSESGLYFLEQSEGTGRTPEDTSYVLVEYSITYLDGTYSAYTSETIAQQLGTYTHSGYYDPRIWSLRDNTPGIVEILTGMQEGGSVKAIIPAILLDQESGLEITQGDGSSLIYDIHLLQVIDNIDEYEIGEVESYLQTNFPGIQDSTDYGFYFSILDRGNSTDTLENEDYTSYRYIGRYLNGTVFDTNIEDTARKYRIYNGDASSYSSSSFQFYDEESDAVENNSLVEGFSKALWRMGFGDRAVVIFISELGYEDAGSGKIPGFVPLRFDIWVEENED